MRVDVDALRDEIARRLREASRAPANHHTHTLARRRAELVAVYRREVRP